MNRVDVAVIGASIAGSAAAIRLGAEGLSVLLTDRVSFPRMKACGEGLSVLGMSELRRLGIAGHDLPGVPFHGFRFHDGKRVCSVVPAPDHSPPAHGIGISRRELDTILYQQAGRNSNVCCIGGQLPVVRPDSKGFVVDVDGKTWRSDFLVLATGAQPELPRMLGVPEFAASRGRAGATLEFETAPIPSASLQAVEIILLPKLEVCCTRTSPTRMNVSFLAHHGNASELRQDRLVKLWPLVRDRIKIEGRLLDTPYGAAGIGRFERARRVGRIFLAGDAIRQLDPIGGMGITHALRTARHAADSIAAELKGRARVAVPAERELRELYAYTALSYWTLAKPLTRTVLAPLRSGRMAQSVLTTMHREPSRILPRILMASAGALS